MPDDAQSLYAIHGDAEAMRWFGTDPMTDILNADHEEMLRRLGKHPEQIAARAAKWAKAKKMIRKPVARWPAFDLVWDCDEVSFHLSLDGESPESFASFFPDGVCCCDVDLSELDSRLCAISRRSAVEIWGFADTKVAEAICFWAGGGKMTPPLVVVVAGTAELHVAGGNNRLAIVRTICNEGNVALPMQVESRTGHHTGNKMTSVETASLARLHGVERSDRISTYAEVAALVGRCREALSRANVLVKPNSALGALFSKADKLNRSWIAQTRKDDIRMLIEADEAAWIAESVLSAVNEPAASEAIRRVTKSDMRLSTRQPSQGKDALWELSLMKFLQLRNVPVRFKDPPDLEISFSALGEYGIACKKVYSEESVGKQLATGLKQIGPYRGAGLVAFNLDDLTPGQSILTAATRSEASARLDAMNRAFIERHQLRFQKAVMEGKCDGIWVSTSVHADITGLSPRFNRITESTLWTLNQAPLGTQLRISEFRQLLDQGGLH